MFRKALLLAALSGAIIGSGALTATSASASTLNSTIDKAAKIFNISNMDEAHQDLFIEALEGFDYDWSQMKPALKAQTGKTQIKVEVIDIAAKWGACGLSWPNGILQIDDQVVDPTWFKQVVQHEVGHMVDFFHLRPAKLHGKIAKIYGASWGVMGHNFNNGFIEVFSTTGAADSSYPLTAGELETLRVLLGGNADLPTKAI